ncbi:MAG: GNAT family N-acetyltransferase [Ardenticatenia bacterium]|nr:GNAT family N-acetyltransferase [Ardenticatenia bacterium]
MSAGVIRPAASEDVPTLADMIARHVTSGDVLPRSAESIRATLGDWAVGQDDDGRVVACGSLWSYSPLLAEVRSLVVEPGLRSAGWGGRVLQALVVEAQRRGIATLFTLTRAVTFFERQGFTITDKSVFPEKIFKDCQACPLIDDCDEIALWMDITGGGLAEELKRQRLATALALRRAQRRAADAVKPLNAKEIER